MSLSVTLSTFVKPPRQTHLQITPTKPKQLANFPLLKLSVLPSIARPSAHRNSGQLPVVSPVEPGWQNVLSTAASLYPLYVTAGGIVACLKPSAFAWFVKRGPASYSLSLGFIMLAMGLTLDFKDLLALLMQRPLSILFGCVAQYTIMPVIGVIVSKSMGLSPSLSVGLILLSCCPGGTASNVYFSLHF
uniref:Putative sodium/metabolite cotransporter BASS1ic n=1 Tax=Rhizophora mucronata TaxID=61149 RepID=A0A2P2IMD0_RHIMU